MSNESPADRRAPSDPAKASPWAWIAVGAVLFAVGGGPQVGEAATQGDRVFGLVVAFIGAAMALVGSIAMGVEIALRRSKQ